MAWFGLSVVACAASTEAFAESPRAPDKISWQLTLEAPPAPPPAMEAGKPAFDYTRSPVMTVDPAVGIFAAVQASDRARPTIPPVAAHIALDGKILWRRPLPELLGHSVETARFIDGGRLVIYGELPDGKRIRARPNDPMPVGRFVVLTAAGDVERIVPIFRASPATHNERVEQADDDHYDIRLAPSRDNGFVAFGGFGGGPYGWWMARYDGAGKQVWQQGDGRLLLTQIDDAQQWMDGRLAVLWVQGALSDEVPAGAHLRVLNAAGHVAMRYSIAQRKSACYRFAGPRVIVAGFADRIVWYDFTGRQLRAVAVDRDPCPLAAAPDGAVVWQDRDSKADGTLGVGHVAGVRPGGNQAWRFALPDIEAVQPLVGGAMIVLSHSPKPSRGIVLRRYD